MAPALAGLPKSSHAQPQADDAGKSTLPPRPPLAGAGQAEAEQAASKEQATSAEYVAAPIRQPDAQQKAVLAASKEQAASKEHAAATIQQPETWREATMAASAEEAVATKGLRREARLKAEPAAAKEPPPSQRGSSAHSQRAVAEAGHASASKGRPGGLERPSPHRRQLEAEQGAAGRGGPQPGLQRSSGRRRQAEGLHRLSHGGRQGRHEHHRHHPPRWAFVAPGLHVLLQAWLASAYRLTDRSC